MDRTVHGTDDQLEQYALGRLPDSDIADLEEHLLLCEACRDRLDAAEAFGRGMREALLTTPVAVVSSTGDWLAPFTAWLRRPAFGMALGLAGLVIAVAIFSSRGTVNLAPTAVLQLTALRGAMPTVEPAQEFDLTLTDGPHDGGPHRVEVLSAASRKMWSGQVSAGATGVEVKFQQKLAPGDYFVRLYVTEGPAPREYGFRVKGDH